MLPFLEHERGTNQNHGMWIKNSAFLPGKVIYPQRKLIYIQRLSIKNFQESRMKRYIIYLFVVYPRFLLSIIQTKDSRPGETCWDPGWPIEDGGCMASICQQDGEGFCVKNQWNFRVGKLNKWHLVPSLKRTVRTWTCFLLFKNGSWIVSQLSFFRSFCCLLQGV